MGIQSCHPRPVGHRDSDQEGQSGASVPRETQLCLPPRCFFRQHGGTHTHSGGCPVQPRAGAPSSPVRACIEGGSTFTLPWFASWPPAVGGLQGGHLSVL